MVPITLGSSAPLVVKIGTKHPKTLIFGRFWILTLNQILALFVLLESLLAFEEVINLQYWKPKLNVRIFVYIKCKILFLSPLIWWSPRGWLPRIFNPHLLSIINLSLSLKTGQILRAWTKHWNSKFSEQMLQHYICPLLCQGCPLSFCDTINFTINFTIIYKTSPMFCSFFEYYTPPPSTACYFRNNLVI